jgi:hypothetical protein
MMGYNLLLHLVDCNDVLEFIVDHYCFDNNHADQDVSGQRTVNRQFLKLIKGE